MSDKLRAVNKLLRGASIEPVDTLAFPDVDVAMAEAALDESKTEMLLMGWWFNSENNWVIPLDSNGRAALPGAVISMQGNEQLHRRPLTGRGGYIYDMETHSTDLTQFQRGDAAVSLDFLTDLNWTDLPLSAENYATVKAARRFALDVDMDANKIQYNIADEENAYGILQRDNMRNIQMNVINSPLVGTLMALAGNPNKAGLSLNPTGTRDE